MKIFTPQQREQLLENGSNPDCDHPPVVRLFLTNTACTWLINELYADKPGLAFGLCDLGFGFPELGFCYLPEIEECETPDKGVFLVRDNAFSACFPMSTYAQAARAYRYVVTDKQIVSEYHEKPVP